MAANRNFTVGLFVTAALVAGIALTIWVTGQKGTAPMTGYSVFIEDDVTGLGLGGPVYFLGVRVGEVDELTIVSGDPPSIRVDIRILASAPVNQGTWATLAPQGVTGVSVINLSNTPGEHPPVQRAGEDTYPTLPYRSSGLSALVSSAPALLDKMEQLVERANAVLSPDNAEALAEVLANVATLSEALADQQTAFASLPETFNGAMEDFQATVGHFDTLLAEAGPSAVTALDHLSEATGRLSDTLGRLDQWVTENQSDLDQFATRGLGQMPGLLAEMRAASRQLEKVLERLEEDPSSLLYKPGARGVTIEE